MNCFDCAACGRSTEAVAICTDCGAAICANHTHTTPRWLTTTVSINRTVAVTPPARTLRCGVCRTAHDALPATA
jgi:hypothetical protein